MSEEEKDKKTISRRQFLKGTALAGTAAAVGGLISRGPVSAAGRPSIKWNKEADVVVVAGMRLTQRIGFGMPPRFNKDAKFIQIDIAAEELGRNRPVDLGLAGDAAASLTKLHQALVAAKAPKKKMPLRRNSPPPASSSPQSRMPPIATSFFPPPIRHPASSVCRHGSTFRGSTHPR